MLGNPGRPKKTSSFICLKCLNKNDIVTGIQRKKQREYGHIKDVYCVHCNEVTKNLESRYMDDYLEVYSMALDLHDEIYESENEGVCGIM